MTNQPPEGYAGFNDLRAALKISNHVLREYIQDPRSPGAAGEYVANNNRTFKYYSIKDFKKYIKKNPVGFIEPPEPDSGWAVPKHSETERRQCRLRRQIDHVFLAGRA